MGNKHGSTRRKKRTARSEFARRARHRLRVRVAYWSTAALAAIVLIAVLSANSGSGRAPASVTADDPVLGQASTPVTIVEYGDFKCPFCTQFSVKTGGAPAG